MNKRIFRLMTALLVMSGIACLALITACEEGKGTQALTISPAEVDLVSTSTNRNTVTFTVTDGLRSLSLPLTWSVSDPTLGRILASGGNSAAYDAYKVTGVNVVTVRDQYEAEGIATVRQ